MAHREYRPEDLPTLFGGMAARLRGANFEKPLKQCSTLIAAAGQECFDRAQDPDGAPWKPIMGWRARGGDKPLRDRGLLMASIVGKAAGHVERIDQTSLVQGTNVDYAAIHQDGKTILPKGRALAIPLTPEAYRSHEANRGHGARNFPRRLVLIWPQGKSHGWLVETKGKKFIMHFLLVPKVTIPARPFLGFGQQLVSDIDNVFLDFLRRTVLEA